MTAYLTGACAIAWVVFWISAAGWSRGLSWRNLARERGEALLVAVGCGALWPLGLLGLALLVVWDRA